MGSCSLQIFYCPERQTRWYPVNPQSCHLPHRSLISLGDAKMRGFLLSPSSTGVVGCPIELVSFFPVCVCVFTYFSTTFLTVSPQLVSLIVYAFKYTPSRWRNFPAFLGGKQTLPYRLPFLIPFFTSSISLPPLFLSLETLTTSSSTFTLPFFVCVVVFFSVFP